MNNILNNIMLNKQRKVDLLKQNFIGHKNPRISNKSFKQSLLKEGLSIIAEIKRRSPITGRLSTIVDPVEVAFNYVQGGAGAISVLTEQHYFGGSIQDLSKIANALQNTNVAVLCKDFIIDPIQINEAIFAGADAVLLIVAILGSRLKPLLDYAKQMNIDALIEVHDVKEIDIALDAGAEIIGINNRNLKTFNVDINCSLQLIRHIPKHLVRVSESGLDSPKATLQIHKVGFDAALVGTALLTTEKPAALIKLMQGQYV